MSLTSEARERGRRIFRGIRDQKRGWTINKYPLFAAYFVETLIIGSTFAAGLAFANKYEEHIDPIQVASVGGSWNYIPFFSGHTEAWQMAMIATIAFCGAELVRMPLVHAFRTYPGIIWRCVFLIGIIAACGITVKSVSQVGEQMFKPRLRMVQEANLELTKAKNKLTEIKTGEGSAKVNLDPLELDVRDAQTKVSEAQKAISENNKNIELNSPAPAPRIEKYSCNQTKSNGKKGKARKVWTVKATCSKTVQDPWTGLVFVEKAPALEKDVVDAKAVLAEKITARNAALGNVTNVAEAVAAQQSVIAEKEGELQAAVSDSQLHSFTAMVFAKDPREVTDQQVHEFLRYFVFYPSIFAALASSIVAMSAYSPVKRKLSPGDEAAIRDAAKTEAEHNIKLSVAEDGTLTKFVDDLVHNQANKTRKMLSAYRPAVDNG